MIHLVDCKYISRPIIFFYSTTFESTRIDFRTHLPSRWTARTITEPLDARLSFLSLFFNNKSYLDGSFTFRPSLWTPGIAFLYIDSGFAVFSFVSFNFNIVSDVHSLFIHLFEYGFLTSKKKIILICSTFDTWGQNRTSHLLKNQEQNTEYTVRWRSRRVDTGKRNVKQTKKQELQGPMIFQMRCTSMETLN